MAEQNLRIVITAQDQASAVMQNVARTTQRSAATMQGAVAGATAALATRGLSLLEGAFQAGAQAVVGFSAALEQSRIAWATMLGGAAQAQAMLSQLQQFANTTPFEFPDVERAARRLTAMGFSARDVIPLLTDVGNAASALGVGAEGVDRIVLALGQMRTRTKVASEEMMQLTDIGVPAWDILARATGRSVAEIQKAVEQGIVPAQVFIDAFRNFASSNYGGLMDAQSRTFVGAMSNIRGSLELLSAQGFEPLFNQMRDSAVAFADFLQSPGVTGFVQVMRFSVTAWMAGWGAIFNATGSALKAITELFSSAWEFITNQTIDALNTEGEVWGNFWGQFSDIATAGFGALQTLAGAAWEGFVNLASMALQKVLEVWNGFVGVLSLLKEHNIPLDPVLDSLAGKFVDASGAAAAFKATLTDLPSVIQATFQKIKAFVSEDVWKAIADAWDAAGVDLTNAAADVGKDMGTALSTGIQQAAKPLQETLNRMFAQLRAGPIQAALEDTQFAIERAQALLRIRGLAPEERHAARQTIRDLTRNVLPPQQLAALDAGRGVTLAQRPEQTAQLLQQIADTQKALADAARGPISVTVNITHEDGSTQTYKELTEAASQASMPPVVAVSGVRR